MILINRRRGEHASLIKEKVSIVPKSRWLLIIIDFHHHHFNTITAFTTTKRRTNQRPARDGAGWRTVCSKTGLSGLMPDVWPP